MQRLLERTWREDAAAAIVRLHNGHMTVTRDGYLSALGVRTRLLPSCSSVIETRRPCFERALPIDETLLPCCTWCKDGCKGRCKGWRKRGRKGWYTGG